MNQKHVESCRKGSWQVSVQSPPKFRSLYLVKDSGAGSGICLGKSAMRGGCGQVSRLLRFPSWHFAEGELVALPFPWPPTKRLPSAAESIWMGRCHGGPEHSRAWPKGKDLLGTRAVLVGHVTAEQSVQTKKQFRSDSSQMPEGQAAWPRWEISQPFCKQACYGLSCVHYGKDVEVLALSTCQRGLIW